MSSAHEGSLCPEKYRVRRRRGSAAAVEPCASESGRLVASAEPALSRRERDPPAIGHPRMTDAVIAAAGAGTRLGALGTRYSKAMVPIAGRPLIDWVLARLRAAGSTRRSSCARATTARWSTSCAPRIPMPASPCRTSGAASPTRSCRALPQLGDEAGLSRLRLRQPVRARRHRGADRARAAPTPAPPSSACSRWAPPRPRRAAPSASTASESSRSSRSRRPARAVAARRRAAVLAAARRSIPSSLALRARRRRTLRILGARRVHRRRRHRSGRCR